MKINKSIAFLVFLIAASLCFAENPLKLEKGSHVVLIGNGLGSRMMNYNHFETELHMRYPKHNLYIRNMCDEGNTPAFRPHPGRKNPWAFPGAEQFFNINSKKNVGVGHFESPDQWITRLKPDVMFAFFGFNESYSGAAGLTKYKAELSAFVDHTLKTSYNGKNPPVLVLVSPTAFQDLSKKYTTPSGAVENANLALYTAAMAEVAKSKKVRFLDIFTPSQKWFSGKEELTVDGALLNSNGYAKLAKYIADSCFEKPSEMMVSKRKEIAAAVEEKNWFWLNHFKIPNGVHVYGRRYKPYGPANYPAELKKMEEMTEVRDQAIWAMLAGKSFDLAAADAKTSKLPEVKTNYKPSAKNGTLKYNYGNEATKHLTVPKGYKIEMFASEKEFNDLANPVQMSFDNKGRLWVAVMPSYPHYKAGNAKPNDKLIILEDTDNDGKADKQTTFADNLHLPIGFEFAPEGVYVTQSPNLVLLRDTNGDDKADVREIIMGGFDDHDTHHAISAYAADPSGAIYMGEGVFLHSNIETAYGPVRSSNGGFFRYSPQRRYLERAARLSIPNPWGIAFDEWGQNFFADTSGPSVRWMAPATGKIPYGAYAPKPDNILEKKAMVRPTSGLEFVSSSHFPPEVQGDLLVNNNIGFLGTKQHQMIDDGTGFKTKFRQDLLKSSDANFRPVDLEFAPDGSLYVIDWHNVLIGHMQHNARDPHRDHAHGRVYRITYPSRPLVKPAKVAGASVGQLLDNLKLAEFRVRYRTRRELRGRNASEVLPAIKAWVAKLDKSAPRYEHYVLEALWVTWGLNRTDVDLLTQVLASKDFRARAAAVRVLRYSTHLIPNHADLLLKAGSDDHGRVRLEAVTAASWLPKSKGMPVIAAAGQKPLDNYSKNTHKAAVNAMNGIIDHSTETIKIKTHLKGAEKKLYVKGAEIYRKEGHCGTCHQNDGLGLSAAQFPPLAKSKWVNQNDERLIMITLKGLMGPIEVNGKKYPGQVPMTPFEGLLKDDDIAAVLTYVKNSFGNKGKPITPDQVKKVRSKVKGKVGFYSPEELLKTHPHK